jgi:DNA invertase Pin-like site-specific DNA recombinase
MTNYAYLRVSTDNQDVENQKLGILDYCNKKNISALNFFKDTASGKLEWQKRGIGKIIEKAKAGDVVVASEISRLARSTLQVLDILETCANKKISVHITKGQMVIDGSMQSTITATILGLAAQIEREFISKRTKEALERAKQSGKKLGRPKGKAKTIKLDTYADQIKDYLKKGVSKRSIARIIECSPSTLYEWIKRTL